MTDNCLFLSNKAIRENLFMQRALTAGQILTFLLFSQLSKRPAGRQLVHRFTSCCLWQHLLEEFRPHHFCYLPTPESQHIPAARGCAVGTNTAQIFLLVQLVERAGRSYLGAETSQAGFSVGGGMMNVFLTCEKLGHL